MNQSYHQRLRAVTRARGTLCVGLDPQQSVLRAWDLPDDVRSIELCARRTVEALGDRVAVFKPQSAFYEVYGSAGIAVLERVIADIAAAGALCLLDVKRGDIGSTMEGYAAAYLAEGSPLSVDAITVSPYLGFESLGPAYDLAARHQRGVYVLARTSNKEGSQVQLARSDSSAHQVPVAQVMVNLAAAENRRSGLDHVGLVVGATHSDLGIDLAGFNGSVLAPGIGAQGGTLSAAAATFAGVSGVVLPSASREVLLGGPTVAGLQARHSQLVGS